MQQMTSSRVAVLQVTEHSVTNRWLHVCCCRCAAVLCWECSLASSTPTRQQGRCWWECEQTSAAEAWNRTIGLQQWRMQNVQQSTGWKPQLCRTSMRYSDHGMAA